MPGQTTLRAGGVQVARRRIAARLAGFIRCALAAGCNGLDLIEAVDARFPDTSLRTFAGALALYYACAGHPNFELVILGRVQ